MSTKKKVLDCLEEHRGSSVSGNELAELIGVSRTAIWKAIKALQEEGHKIESKTNEGYMLALDSDRLSEEGILNHLPERYKNSKIIVYDIIDSTNKQAKLYANDEGFSKDTSIKVFVAEEQTAGRGRLGKTFYSPKSTGLYMSILLRPDKTESIQMITIAAAVAVCDGIKELYGIDVSIKWVNDIYIGGKKICGILTEAVTDFESGTIDNIVVGIGINCTTEDFPEDISGIASSLQEGEKALTIVRNQLAAKIVEKLGDMWENLGNKEIIEKYRQRSFMVGKEVSFVQKGIEYKGIVENINDFGNLCVKLSSGENMILASGEVSVKGDWKK